MLQPLILALSNKQRLKEEIGFWGITCPDPPAGPYPRLSLAKQTTPAKAYC